MYQSISCKMIPFEEIEKFVKPIRVLGPKQSSIKDARQLSTSDVNSISFCSYNNNEAIVAIKNSNAGIVLTYDDVKGLEQITNQRCILTVQNPKLSFIRILNHYFSGNLNWEIHPSAIIENKNILSKKILIGPQSYIGQDVDIGERCIIEGHVHIACGTKIGNNVRIQSGAIIGCDGQGMIRNESGVFENFPQIGGVEIHNDVEIGANTTISRGTFDNTVIREGSKIGHQCNVGHNVSIGKHVFISAGSILCGSSIIGDFSWVAPGAIIRDGVKIESDVQIGMGAIVLKNVDRGAIVFGNPAKEKRLKK